MGDGNASFHQFAQWLVYASLCELVEGSVIIAQQAPVYARIVSIRGTFLVCMVKLKKQP
jgi:hypothetical protein